MEPPLLIAIGGGPQYTHTRFVPGAVEFVRGRLGVTSSGGHPARNDARRRRIPQVSVGWRFSRVPLQGRHASDTATRQHFVALRRPRSELGHGWALSSRRRLVENAAIFAAGMAPSAPQHEAHVEKPGDC